MSVDIVIGANFGDESKGLTTARIAKSYNDYDNTIVILNNGGSQRGHSVNFENKEHIFKHFGSATPLGVATCFGPDYILNPMQFVKEQQEIYKTFGFYPKCYRSYDCMWSTPFDMMANQMRQKEKWTGTCGMGIWETIKRYKAIPTMTFTVFCSSDIDSQKSHLRLIRDWYYTKFEKINVAPEYKDAWFSEGTIDHFIHDCLIMYKQCIVSNDAFNKAHIIIENGQGLLLCDDGTDNSEKTPSETGIKTLRTLGIKERPVIHFVTRPYITRHGSLICENNKNIAKLTDNSIEINQYNEWQHDFNYSKLDIKDLKRRLDIEAKKANVNNYILEVTHCDEIDNEKKFKKNFSNVNFYDTNKL